MSFRNFSRLGKHLNSVIYTYNSGGHGAVPEDCEN